VTVRAANYAWPISGSQVRDVQLNWVAADPTMYDPMTSTVEAKTGTEGALFTARYYPLTFDRVYQTPGGAAPIQAVIESPGDIDLRPLFRIHGPVTAAHVDLYPAAGSVLHLWLNDPVRIDAGHYLEIDSLDHTAYYDSGLSGLTDIDWANSTWPVLAVLPERTTMVLTGTSADATTRAQAIWHDGFVA
jgi:hypothetical protein